MSSQPKDIVDRLSYLKQMLNEQKENPRNKTKRINQYYQFFNNNKLKTQRNTKNNNELNNDEFSHDQTEIIYQDIEEEEEEEEDENEQNYSYDNENQTEYNENTEYISKFESNEIIAPIPKFTKIKSDAKTFAKLTFFRRWRRAFQAKRIQITISNKMKKYKQKDGDKENGIYKPCYDPFSFKKATKTEQLESIERLSKPRNKINNHIPPHSNPQYTPKTDKEKKNGQRRHLVRQIAIERDENEQKTKPVTQKEMDKIIRRLLLPKKTIEKVPENPRPTISQKKQFENALRLSVPKKKEDKNDDDENQLKTNRFILPTKKEQLEICTRLSQPKPDFSPKPIKQKPTITQAEQMEICERLSGINKENLKKKKIEIKEEEVFKKKAHKKSKKKGRKNRKKKNRQIQNDESLTFLSNKQVVLPTASPVPTQNLPASPLNINTPRKVRFNGFQSTPKEKLEKYSRILSKEVDEAIGEITENNSISSTQLQNKTQQEFSSTQLSDDDFQQNLNSIQISPLFKVTPTPKIERQKKTQRAGRRASYTPTRYQQYQKEDQNLAKDDTGVNQKTTKRNVYHTLAGYRRKSIQGNTHFNSSDDGERYSHEAIRSSEDEQNQVKDSIIMDDKNESEIHISNIDSKEEIILSSQNPEKDAQKEEEETNKNELIIIEEEEEVDETEIKINQEEEEEKQTSSSKVEIIINKEEDDELFDEEEEDQLQSHSTSLLKSSENENNDDDDEFNQDKFYFESPRSNEFQFEEELNEKRNHIIDDDDDEIVHDSSKLTSKGQRSFSSEIESETIKEIDKTDLDQFVKDNLLIINEEEEDENDEVVINDNISGIEAHTPINGLISNSGFEINLLSNTQDSS